MAIKTQGSQLYIIDTTGSAGCELIKIECSTSLSGLSNPREQIEVTCLESDTRQFVGGLSTPGQLSVTVNFDPSLASHMKLYNFWKANGENFKFAIGLGVPVNSDPTIDSGCDFAFPDNRSFVEAEGYVVDIPLEIALNSVVTSTIPIQISGDYNLFPKTV